MTSNCLPKRILMTTDTIGGVWTYAVELAGALADFGIETGLATMGAPLNPAQAEEAQSVENVTVFESTYRLEWMQDPWEQVERAGEWLLELEEDFSPDVVHLNGYVHGSLPFKSPVVVVGHSCVLSWWESVRNECAPPECWGTYREKVAEGLRAADMVVAPTEAMLAALNCHYGRLRRSMVIPNGRDADLFAAAGKEPFILAAGRLWDEAKNIKVLESVSRELDWPIYIAGEDLHPDGGRMECSGVCGLGRLSARELADWFARASIYVLPARYEPFGLTVLEAALSGCALVLGDIPSLRENWSDAAVFVRPDDIPQIGSAIAEIARDRPYREHLANRARIRALDFTPRRMAQSYIGVYRDLLTGKTQPYDTGRRTYKCA